MILCITSVIRMLLGLAVNSNEGHFHNFPQSGKKPKFLKKNLIFLICLTSKINKSHCLISYSLLIGSMYFVF